MVWYVKESEKKRLFNRVTVKDDVVLVWVSKKDRKIKKAVKKLRSILEANNVSSIVLSEHLEQNDVLRQYIYEQSINVLSGKKLFNYLIYDIVKYIAKKKNKQIEILEVSMLTENENEIDIENIVLLAKNIKRFNIITSDIRKFKKIEEYLREELGIIIKVSSNKRKALLKTDIIVNTGFSSTVINKYIIANECVIVNVCTAVKYKAKKFNGININGYKIKIPSEYKVDGFSDEAVYESKICRGNFDNIRKKIKKDKVEIAGLIGNNGVINEQEYKT